MNDGQIDIINPNSRKRTFETNEKNCRRMHDKSVSGNNVRRTHKKRKVSQKSASRKMKKYFGAAIFGAVVAVGITNITEDLMEKSTINGMTSNFYESVIFPATHRTDNKEAYYYDYQDIALKVQGMDNFDEGVYYLTESIGEEKTNFVLAYTEYDSLDNYEKSRGFEDLDDFRKKMHDMIVLDDEIEEKKEELKMMLDAVENQGDKANLNVEGIGGK